MKPSEYAEKQKFQSWKEGSQLSLKYFQGDDPISIRDDFMDNFCGRIYILFIENNILKILTEKNLGTLDGHYFYPSSNFVMSLNYNGIVMKHASYKNKMKLTSVGSVCLRIQFNMSPLCFYKTVHITISCDKYVWYSAPIFYVGPTNNEDLEYYNMGRSEASDLFSKGRNFWKIEMQVYHHYIKRMAKLKMLKNIDNLSQNSEASSSSSNGSSLNGSSLSGSLSGSSLSGSSLSGSSLSCSSSSSSLSGSTSSSSSLSGSSLSGSSLSGSSLIGSSLSGSSLSGSSSSSSLSGSSLSGSSLSGSDTKKEIISNKNSRRRQLFAKEEKSDLEGMVFERKDSPEFLKKDSQSVSNSSNNTSPNSSSVPSLKDIRRNNSPDSPQDLSPKNMRDYDRYDRKGTYLSDKRMPFYSAGDRNERRPYSTGNRDQRRPYYVDGERDQRGPYHAVREHDQRGPYHQMREHDQRRPYYGEQEHDQPGPYYGERDREQRRLYHADGCHGQRRPYYGEQERDQIRPYYDEGECERMIDDNFRDGRINRQILHESNWDSRSIDSGYKDEHQKSSVNSQEQRLGYQPMYFVIPSNTLNFPPNQNLSRLPYQIVLAPENIQLSQSSNQRVQYVQDPRVQDSRVQDSRVQDPRVQDPRVQDSRVQAQRVLSYSNNR